MSPAKSHTYLSWQESAKDQAMGRMNSTGSKHLQTKLMSKKNKKYMNLYLDEALIDIFILGAERSAFGYVVERNEKASNAKEAARQRRNRKLSRMTYLLAEQRAE